MSNGTTRDVGNGKRVPTTRSGVINDVFARYALSCRPRGTSATYYCAFVLFFSVVFIFAALAFAANFIVYTADVLVEKIDIQTRLTNLKYFLLPKKSKTGII